MITLTDSIEIKTTPEQVFNWLTNLGTKEDYRAWHPNHIDWRWIKGKPFQKGSIVYCEEYIHGNKDKFKFTCSEVVPNKLIEYKPSFPMSILMSKGQFVLKPKNKNCCVFTAVIIFRKIFFFKKLFARQIKGLRQHMREEGINLKKILESKESK